MTTQTAEKPAQTTDLRYLKSRLDGYEKGLDESKSRILFSLTDDKGWVDSFTVDRLARYGAIKNEVAHVRAIIARLHDKGETAETIKTELTGVALNRLKTSRFVPNSTSATSNLMDSYTGEFWQEIANALDFC